MKSHTTCEGEYLLPPESPQIGVWGMRRLRFLKQHHDGIYTGLLLSGKLHHHLEETDRSANEMHDRLVKQHAEREGAAEELKAQDQMAGMRRMNGIRKRVEEVILQELRSTLDHRRR